MISIVQNLEIISHSLNKRILALFNKIDDRWDFYYCNNFTPKTNLDPTYKLVGYRITEYVENFQNTSLSSESFKFKLGKEIYQSDIEWSHEDFVIVKGVLDE